MALIPCPNCGTQFSDAAPSCPACGQPNPTTAPPPLEDAPPAGGTPEIDPLGTVGGTGFGDPTGPAGSGGSTGFGDSTGSTGSAGTGDAAGFGGPTASGGSTGPSDFGSAPDSGGSTGPIDFGGSGGSTGFGGAGGGGSTGPIGGGGAPSEKIPNYLIPAILMTLCCCQPVAIVAIVFAAQVNSKRDRGDLEGARAASKNARLWLIISGVLVVVGWLIGLAFGVMGVILAALGGGN